MTWGKNLIDYQLTAGRSVSMSVNDVCCVCYPYSIVIITSSLHVVLTGVKKSKPRPLVKRQAQQQPLWTVETVVDVATADKKELLCCGPN